MPQLLNSSTIQLTMNNKKIIIKLEDIETAPDEKLQINFEEFIDGIKSDKSIKATLEAVNLGEFIKITGHVQGTVILECDLCLNEFEYELSFDIDELFAKNALQEEYAQETELKEGQFITDLEGTNSIDIYDLLYQSVILDFPNKKVCGINCKGSGFLSEKDLTQNETDPRLDIFKNIDIKRK